jgi:hypothetical protein
MTPRERLFALLDRRPVDRTPMWLLFPWRRVGYYADVRGEPSYAAVQQAAEQRCITLDRCHLGAPLWREEVTCHAETLVEGGDTVHRRTVTWKGRSLVAETRSGPGGTSVRHLLETEDDLLFYLELPLERDPARLEAALAAQLPDFLAARAAFPAHLGATMLDLGEPVNALYHESRLDAYALWSVEHGAAITAWLDRAMERLRVVYRWCLERRLAETYFLVGSELASPPLLSRRTFQRWVVPYASELIAAIRAAGCRSIQHYHGQIRLLLDDFATMAPDALHTIEAPPTGNCTLSQAWEALGDRMVLVGNVQYDRFRAATPAEMRAEVEAVLREAAGRRLILSPSAGPYQAAIDARMRDNYLAFIDAGWNWPTGR